MIYNTFRNPRTGKVHLGVRCFPRSYIQLLCNSVPIVHTVDFQVTLKPVTCKHCIKLVALEEGRKL